MISLFGFVIFVGSLDIFVQIVTAVKRANKPKVSVPQAQDPIALIGELVKALNFIPILELEINLVRLIEA